MAEKELEDLILHLNREAMTYLKEENYQLSLKTLKNAEKLLKSLNSPSSLKIQGITLNNFGCFYKRLNKPNVALKFLLKACEKESVEPIDRVNLSGTLLNLCAIYSQLGKHDQALEQSIKALSLLEQEREKSPNLVSTLIIAYHNTGVEYEFLNDLKQAVECFKSAWSFSVKQLGESNNLTLSIHKTYLDAQEKLAKKDRKFGSREQQRTNSRAKSHDRRNLTAFPVIKRENIYTKPKIQIFKKDEPAKMPEKEETQISKKDEPAKIPEKEMLNKAPVLNQVRFLTGDRLQPMFQMKTQKIKLRPGSKSAMKGKSRLSEKEKAKNFQTVTSNMHLNIGDLENKRENCEEKKEVRPLSKDLIDLESFKFENITAAYEIEKLNELDNKRKKIEEEKEKFLKNLKKMEEIEKKLNDGKEKKQDLDQFSAENKQVKERNEATEVVLQKSGKGSVRTPLTSTQACFQGYVKRKRLDRRTQAAIMIQKHVRRYQCRSIYVEIKEAIVFIQSFYRGHLVRKNRKKESVIN